MKIEGAWGSMTERDQESPRYMTETEVYALRSVFKVSTRLVQTQYNES